MSTRRQPPAQPNIRLVLKAQVIAQLDRIRAEVEATTEKTATSGDLCEVLRQLDDLHAFGRVAKGLPR